MDTMLQGVWLHLMSYCARKQMASGKNYPIEAADSAEDKMLVAFEEKMVQFLVTDVQTGDYLTMLSGRLAPKILEAGLE